MSARRIKKQHQHFLFDRHYDSYLAWSMCVSYRETRDASLLNELLLQIAPLIGLVARYRIGSNACDYDIVRSDAFIRMYDIFRGNGDIPLASESRFSWHLSQVIYREMIDSIRAEPHAIYDYHVAAVLPPQGRIPTQIDVDYRLHYLQTRELLRKLAIDEIRFNDQRDYDACKYIISCILGYITLKPESVQFRHRLSKKRATILIQYCHILVRRLSYDVKEMVDANP